MVTIQQFPSSRQINLPRNRDGLNHLFATAVVSRQFRKLLLEDPETALQRGYLGEQFDLSRDERERLTSAHARSLADLVKTFGVF